MKFTDMVKSNQIFQTREKINERSAKSQTLLLVCDWPHSVWTKSLVCKDAVLQGIPLFRSVSQDSASQKSWFPTSRPDDMSSRPDAHLSTVPSDRKMCHTVRMPR
jgi:hypothetical protein